MPTELGRVSLESLPARRGWVLRFLAGRYQGGAVVLVPGGELTIGRVPEVDLSLPDELTSRRHARIAWEGEVPVVEDLGSTNGTFVNGERVKRRRLQDGDRILIGGNILRLASELQPSPGDATTMPGLERSTETPVPRRQSAMQGQLEEVGLPDVLQLIGTSKKTGHLAIRSGDRRGAVHLDGGRITHCLLEGRPELSHEEVMVELLQWVTGSFELRPSAQPPPPGAPLDLPVEAVLMDAMRRLDEARR
ncbi:MAG: DUF4388 domain-containing protein [Deltaproteobacteria bacterium]|nr:DUF4388 domain-containing protein [Deltaproteobacteria bacterium]